MDANIEVKCKRPLLGFEFELWIPFPMMITMFNNVTNVLYCVIHIGVDVSNLFLETYCLF